MCLMYCNNNLFFNTLAHFYLIHLAQVTWDVTFYERIISNLLVHENVSEKCPFSFAPRPLIIQWRISQGSNKEQ